MKVETAIPMSGDDALTSRNTVGYKSLKGGKRWDQQIAIVRTPFSPLHDSVTVVVNQRWIIKRQFRLMTRYGELVGHQQPRRCAADISAGLQEHACN